MKESVIVVGKQGCGKSEKAENLKAHFALGNIVDNWVPGQNIPDDTLVLTNADEAEIPEGMVRVVRFEDVLHAA